MNDRIKQIRKHPSINLSQIEFGEQLGVTGAAISKIESGDRNLTDSMIKLICREFNVNYDWLVYGDGEMFSSPPETLVDELVQEFNLDETGKRIILGYIRLSEEDRAAVGRYLQNIFSAGE